MGGNSSHVFFPPGYKDLNQPDHLRYTGASWMAQAPYVEEAGLPTIYRLTVGLTTDLTPWEWNLVRSWRTTNPLLVTVDPSICLSFIPQRITHNSSRARA